MLGNGPLVGRIAPHMEGSRMVERREQFDYEDLLACARGELFGPGNAQLPLPPMLMFDRISEVKEEGGEHGYGRIVAELDVKPDLWFFPCHFKGDPVMPGCLGLDALWQLLGFFLGWLGAPGTAVSHPTAIRSRPPRICASAFSMRAKKLPPVRDRRQPGTRIILSG